MRIAGPPEERPARLAEDVERAHEGEVAQGLLLEADASRELVERRERAVRAFGDDRLRLGLPQRLHRREPETHVVHAAGAVAGDRLREVRQLLRLRVLTRRLDR